MAVIFTFVALSATLVFVAGQTTLHSPVPKGGDFEDDLESDV